MYINIPTCQRRDQALLGVHEQQWPWNKAQKVWYPNTRKQCFPWRGAAQPARGVWNFWGQIFLLSEASPSPARFLCPLLQVTLPWGAPQPQLNLCFNTELLNPSDSDLTPHTSPLSLLPLHRRGWEMSFFGIPALWACFLSCEIPGVCVEPTQEAFGVINLGWECSKGRESWTWFCFLFINLWLGKIKTPEESKWAVGVLFVVLREEGNSQQSASGV